MYFKRKSLRLFRFSISQFVPFWINLSKYGIRGQIVKLKSK